MGKKGIGPLAALSESLADAVEKIQPSVVRVRGGRRWPASGLVYAEGLVLTTAHALEREEDLSVDTHGVSRCPRPSPGATPATTWPC
jgi:S1-C subfamily serine protease